MPDLRKHASRADTMSEGAWCEYADGIEVQIRSARSPQALQVLNEQSILDQSARRKNQGILDKDRAFRKKLFPVLVRGWRNLELDGQAVECTPDEVLRICMDPEFHDFADWIIGEANNDANYAHEAREDASGN